MALYDDGCSGVLNRVHAQLLHVLPSSLFAMSSKCVRDVMVKWKMKSWTVTRVIMWLCVIMATMQAKIEFLSHLSSIYLTPRYRCRAQTYTPEPRCHTSYTGGLVWAVRLWISCRGATMCSKCHACMPVCKMYNPCTKHLTPQPCGKPPMSGSAVLLDKNDPSMFFNFTKIILVNIWILN